MPINRKQTPWNTDYNPNVENIPVRGSESLFSLQRSGEWESIADFLAHSQQPRSPRRTTSTFQRTESLPNGTTVSWTKTQSPRQTVIKHETVIPCSTIASEHNGTSSGALANSFDQNLQRDLSFMPFGNDGFNSNFAADDQLNNSEDLPEPGVFPMPPPVVRQSGPPRAHAPDCPGVCGGKCMSADARRRRSTLQRPLQPASRVTTAPPTGRRCTLPPRLSTPRGVPLTGEEPGATARVGPGFKTGAVRKIPFKTSEVEASAGLGQAGSIPATRTNTPGRVAFRSRAEIIPRAALAGRPNGQGPSRPYPSQGSSTTSPSTPAGPSARSSTDDLRTDATASFPKPLAMVERTVKQERTYILSPEGAQIVQEMRQPRSRQWGAARELVIDPQLLAQRPIGGHTTDPEDEFEEEDVNRLRAKWTPEESDLPPCCIKAIHFEAEHGEDSWLGAFGGHHHIEPIPNWARRRIAQTPSLHGERPVHSATRPQSATGSSIPASTRDQPYSDLPEDQRPNIDMPSPRSVAFIKRVIYEPEDMDGSLPVMPNWATRGSSETRKCPVRASSSTCADASIPSGGKKDGRKIACNKDTAAAKSSGHVPCPGVEAPPGPPAAPPAPLPAAPPAQIARPAAAASPAQVARPAAAASPAQVARPAAAASPVQKARPPIKASPAETASLPSVVQLECPHCFDLQDVPSGPTVDKEPGGSERQSVSIPCWLKQQTSKETSCPPRTDSEAALGRSSPTSAGPSIVSQPVRLLKVKSFDRTMCAKMRDLKGAPDSPPPSAVPSAPTQHEDLTSKEPKPFQQSAKLEVGGESREAEEMITELPLTSTPLFVAPTCRRAWKPAQPLDKRTPHAYWSLPTAEPPHWARTYTEIIEEDISYIADEEISASQLTGQSAAAHQNSDNATQHFLSIQPDRIPSPSRRASGFAAGRGELPRWALRANDRTEVLHVDDNDELPECCRPNRTQAADGQPQASAVTSVPSVPLSPSQSAGGVEITNLLPGWAAHPGSRTICVDDSDSEVESPPNEMTTPSTRSWDVPSSPVTHSMTLRTTISAPSLMDSATLAAGDTSGG